MRYFANGIKEIGNWLARHPSDVLVLNLENYVGCAGSSKCQGDPLYIADPLTEYLDGPGRQWVLRPPPKGSAPQPLPSRAEMLGMGKRVVVIFNGNIIFYAPDGSVAPDIGFDEGTVVAGGYESWLRNNQDFDGCIDTLPGATAHYGPATATPDQFTVVVEDRTLQRGFVELLEQFLGKGPGAFGELSVADMRKVARCNYTIVATDFLGSQLPLGRRLDLPDFSRHEALVWSWKPADRGQNGDCAMLEASSGRWVSSDCGQPRHYVCAPPRSESGTVDRSAWQQREGRWRVTAASGSWEGGAAACAAEFPFDPEEGIAYVFSVPVNGYQNERLKAANTAGLDLWLNYTDQAKEGSWIIPRLANVNTPPVADAGPDRTITCGADATLDGSASVDADGDALTFTWIGPFGTLMGPVVNARLAAGVNVITLTVQDGKGGVGTDSVSITVADTTAPSLSVSLSPSILWPSHHDMVSVVADVRAEDVCDGSDVLVELASIVSSEAEDQRGAGKTGPDIQDALFGTGDLEFSLRAERSGAGSGRVYTVTYRATDKAGNATEVSAEVAVPHDKGRGLSARFFR